MGSGFSFGVGRKFGLMLHLYRSSEELGKQMSLFHFLFYIVFFFVSIYISSDGSVIFTVLFGTFLNLMYCMVVFLHVYWIYR